MKKKTKKAAKPRPKIKTVTIMAWNPNRIVVRQVTGSELDIEMAIERLVRNVCPSEPDYWQRLNANVVVEVRR